MFNAFVALLDNSLSRDRRKQFTGSPSNSKQSRTLRNKHAPFSVRDTCYHTATPASLQLLKVVISFSERRTNSDNVYGSAAIHYRTNWIRETERTKPLLYSVSHGDTGLVFGTHVA
jgi:hypothetical protein